MARGVGSLAAAALLAALWPATAAAQTDVADVLAAEASLRDAIAAKSRAALLTLTADDFRTGGVSASGRDEWLEQLMGPCAGGRSDVRDMQTAFRGDTALVSFEATTTVEPPCLPLSTRSRIAHLWIRVDGGWRLSLRSVSALEPVPPPRSRAWVGTAELTVLSTHGNVSTFTFGSAGDFAWQRGRTRTNVRAAFLRTTAGGLERGRSVDLQVRQARVLTPVIELFGRALYQRDLFSGMLNRYGADTGIGLVFTHGAHRVQATFGGGSTHEQRLAVAAQSAPVATAGLQYRFSLTTATTVTNDALATGTLTRGANWRLDNTLAATTVVRQPFALRVSYATKYLHHPVPGFRNLDAILSIGLVARL